MSRVRLTKLSDDRFSGSHPNGIIQGYTKEGVLHSSPEVGSAVYVGGMHTSTVTEIVDTNTFKTLNSTYKIEYLD